MHIPVKKLPVFVFALTLFLAALAGAQEKDAASVFSSVRWQKGPVKADMGGIAEIAVPEGYLFADGADTRRLMEAMNNLPTNREQGFIAPENLEWFVVFEFDEAGYVKDDEKDQLDADAMLASLREGQDHANEEMKRRGWATLTIEGWAVPPKYNTETNNLEWAPRLKSSKGGSNINYNTRLLGRTGVMSVTLVLGVDKLAQTLPLYKGLLAGYTFKQGKRYAEYREGDRLAQYGLAALVTGGAAAVAAKTGLLAKFGKFFVLLFAKLGKGILLVVLAVAAGVKKLFSVFGGRNSDPPPQ